ncbi:proton-conducting transporter membrane subunit [Teichococcus deserti]|uniref:proton-conducting transporter transmembrane domain-containing protein n=1 Tax=Teichococcus deserti TaxID=1817963 RepID=UPI001054C299|nr:proton-conducting transporter membrane subunit [Pseudoroseomonas deserti]
MTLPPALLLGLLLLAALLAVAAPFLAAAARPRLGRLVPAACILAALGLAGCAASALALGAPEPLLLPFGPPWGPMSLALDGLSAWFLLLLGLSGAACALFAALREAAAPPRQAAGLPLLLAGLALTLLAADGFSLLLGLGLTALALWLPLAAGEAEDAAPRLAAGLALGFSLFSLACLATAIGLLAGTAGDLSFAALRAAPPQGWQAAAVMALVMLGAGAGAGLLPLHGWLPLLQPHLPASTGALLSAVVGKVFLYVAARLLLDIGGPAQPLGWGVPLLAAGAATAVFGALRATQEGDARSILACAGLGHLGLVALAFGLSASLRAADLGALAALAAGAGLLHALGHGLFQTLLTLVVGEIQHSAGSRRLDRLGGLIHAMPAVALAAIAGCAAAAALPPMAGFAGNWLLLQALLAAWRVGELGFQVLVAAAVASVGVAASLGALAMLRFWALAFLGRPRAPRTLGAQEPPRALRFLFLALAGAAGGIGILPGPLLQLATPALSLVSGHAGPAEISVWSVSAAAAASDYRPLGIALLLAVAFLGLVALLRQISPRATVRGPAWDGGFAAPPPHLPFGEPLTQPSALGFAQPLRRMLARRLLAAREDITLPPPGDTGPARLQSHFHDPLLPALLAPLLRARAACADQAERLRDLSIRHLLGMVFFLILALLGVLAWWGGGA